jgi:hypothetical protein
MKKALLVLALVGFTGSAFANDAHKAKSAVPAVENSATPSEDTMNESESAPKEEAMQNAAAKGKAHHKAHAKKGKHGKMKKSVEETESH